MASLGSSRILLQWVNFLSHCANSSIGFSINSEKNSIFSAKMVVIRLVTSQLIIKKIEAHGLTRKQIAEALGVSPATLNGWMAPNAPRPVPKPVTLLLQKILADLHSDTELRFTFAETEQIQRAMNLSGAKSFYEFAYQAVMNKANVLVAHDQPLVAEDDAAYQTQKKP
jgi:transcriptional regulator with XRE-family HTH domain